MQSLTTQFRDALTMTEISGTKRDRAIAAHSEIRELLESDAQLCAWGVDTVLIGSYARHTGIYPGKDVDVFTKLTKLGVDSIDPRTIVEYLKRVLVAEYGDRAELQPRSVKISFDANGEEFSVDVVPAVHFGTRWAIPTRDREQWDDRSSAWVETDPELLTELTTERNRQPVVGGQGAYVPVVKLVRQTRRHHLDKAKPGGFYFELMTYWAFDRGLQLTTYAELFAGTLRSCTDQLASGIPLRDPVLQRDYAPAPNPEDLQAAARVFADLAAQASEALQADRCPAAAVWRRILGQNDRGWCFPVPEGCDADGRALKVSAVGAGRGSREAGGFG